MKILKKKAFTFVELVVVIIIISILSTIGFTQFQGNISSWRDTLRTANISEISLALKNQKQVRGSYPIPSNNFKIKIWTPIVAWQWKLDTNIWLSTIDDIPLDPKLNIPYLYSISANRQEFEIALALENNDWENNLAFLKWDYKSISKNILPTLILATGSISEIDINSWNNKDLFIFKNQGNNLPYNFEWSLKPTSNWTSFADLLNKAENDWNFSQNSNFETCLEILMSWKYLWNWEYQIRTNTWALANIVCFFNS